MYSRPCFEHMAMAENKTDLSFQGTCGLIIHIDTVARAEKLLCTLLLSLAPKSNAVSHGTECSSEYHKKRCCMGECTFSMTSLNKLREDRAGAPGRGR